MRKAEVQTLVAFVRSGGQVVLFLLLAHSIPLDLSLSVNVHIEPLGENK